MKDKSTKRTIKLRGKEQTVTNNSPALKNYLEELVKSEKIQEIIQESKTLNNVNINTNKNIVPPILAILSKYSQQIKAKNPRQIVAVIPDSKNAQIIAEYLKSFTENVAYLPAWETLPHERLSPRIDTMSIRNKVLSNLVINSQNLAENQGESLENPIQILVTSARAFVQPIIINEKRFEKINLSLNQEIDFEYLQANLTNIGYTRAEVVSTRGEYAVHGGIIDIFIPTEEHPIRLEFFGDEIDSMEYFSVENQRTLGKEVKQVTIYACRELIIDEHIKFLAQTYKQQMPEIAHMLEKIENGIYPQGFESLSSIFNHNIEPITKLISDDSIIVLQNIESIKKIYEDLEQTAQEFLEATWKYSQSEEETPIGIDTTSFYNISDLLATTKPTISKWYIGEIGEGEDIDTNITLPVNEIPNYNSNYKKLCSDLQNNIRTSKQIFISNPNTTHLERLEKILNENDIPTRISSINAHKPTTYEPHIVHLLDTQATNGYEFEDIVFITHNDISSKINRNESKKNNIRKRQKAIDPMTLKPGDYIVHSYHGIGRFVELTSREIKKNTYREYIVIEYAPSIRGKENDKLFVPTDSLDRISKYTGGTPTLHKLGGSDWAKAKQKARKAIREITTELVQLYAKRANAKGYAFSPDTPWQRELESSFEHVETADQLTVIEEIKKDMEKPTPMDRLLCGDVGYGKTEVAVRATFKAVQDGKQVAVLAPTTLLAQQHYETFSNRYLSFPVKVACLSRFTPDKQAEKILQELSEGTIDVIIGTHRLLTGRIRFKDLGLIIIDEEQRFGVEHKETLKQFKNNIDVLSMSATPIPRTLEMAVTGIREMSTLSTPPEERYPILTYVGAYKDRQVVAAIKRELLRDGQVFYVHNKVEDIDKVAHKIKNMIPQARIAVAHGKMNETQLEKIIVDFWNRQYDVLVCTTIVETGLDIPNVNTLIIDKAENFGLSQLHQLRGRVGRGNERAYAYFLYSENKTLTDTAQERLETIATNTDLGSGIRVALKDLEIRGAGNLLGGAQSGHIEGVGFDLYMRMLTETIEAFKGEYVPDVEIKIDLPFDTRIPEEYIPSENQRLEMYSKISSAKDNDALQEVLTELRDRFGYIDPKDISGLLSSIKVKFIAKKYGFEEIAVQGKYIRFAPIVLSESQLMRLMRLYPKTVIKQAIRAILVPLEELQKYADGAIDDFEFADKIEDSLKKIFDFGITIDKTSNSGVQEEKLQKAKEFAKGINKKRGIDKEHEKDSVSTENSKISKLTRSKPPKPKMDMSKFKSKSDYM